MKLLTVLILSLLATVAKGENYWKLGVDPLGFQNHEDVLVYLPGGEYEVAAFVVNDSTLVCRGVQASVDNDTRIVMVYGTDGETIVLRVWNYGAGEFESVEETFTFDSSQPKLEFDFRNALGIKAVTTDDEVDTDDGSAYDLTGRRIVGNSHGSKKIVIINGKKRVR